jgi:hypothetical protein
MKCTMPEWKGTDHMKGDRLEIAEACMSTHAEWHAFIHSMLKKGHTWDDILQYVRTRFSGEALKALQGELLPGAPGLPTPESFLQWFHDTYVTSTPAEVAQEGLRLLVDEGKTKVGKSGGWYVRQYTAKFKRFYAWAMAGQTHDELRMYIHWKTGLPEGYTAHLVKHLLTDRKSIEAGLKLLDALEESRGFSPNKDSSGKGVGKDKSAPNTPPSSPPSRKNGPRQGNKRKGPVGTVDQGTCTVCFERLKRPVYSHTTENHKYRSPPPPAPRADVAVLAGRIDTLEEKLGDVADNLSDLAGSFKSVNKSIQVLAGQVKKTPYWHGDDSNNGNQPSTSKTGNKGNKGSKTHKGNN